MDLQSTVSYNSIEVLHGSHVAWQEQWKCFALTRTFVPIGKRIYCSYHATWLPCKPSIDVVGSELYSVRRETLQRKKIDLQIIPFRLWYFMVYLGYGTSGIWKTSRRTPRKGVMNTAAHACDKFLLVRFYFISICKAFLFTLCSLSYRCRSQSCSWHSTQNYHHKC